MSVLHYSMDDEQTALEVPGLTARLHAWRPALSRCAALVLALAVLPVIVGSCTQPEPEETSPATDYSSPIADDHLPMPVSDYSSPAAVGAAPSLDSLALDAEPEPIRGPRTEVVPADRVEKIRTISHGEAIVPGNYLVAGSTTIFDFHSDYSPPCLRIAPHLERLMAARGDLYLVIVDINRPAVSATKSVDWNSPVAMQYSIRSLPFFVIHDQDGDIALQGRPASQQLYDWINALED